MKSFHKEKKLLIEKLFKAGAEVKKTNAKNTIAEHFELDLKDKYDYDISARTLVRCYDNIYEGKNPDYKLKDDIGWDFISKIIGYKDFNDFCEAEKSSTILEDHTVLEEILHTLVGIKESIAFGLSRFIEKRSGFGLVGLLFIAGIILNQYDIFTKEKPIVQKILDSNIVENNKLKDGQNTISTPIIIYPPEKGKENTNNPIINEKKKECMYWNGEMYIPVFCNEKIENYNVIQLNEEQLKIKRITRPDTLTIENAMGKVWYDKANNKVFFFTHYGLNPENGKSLKDVSEGIIEKYCGANASY